MDTLETPTSDSEIAVEDDGFDPDFRIVVGKEVQMPESGFSCSWYTCSQCCTITSRPDRCC
ncbi:hypothetical protein [Glycomyces harbinensis]|uniref:Lantibiotic n=1 Tax=Glycomyces harbinensis TaxID=58114 RepID=A0A1G6WSU1_9ACTN|nr:hypothetical protein [Glycomyces harbinensis]SDD68874.1 hypothetical protein SAMN05216270_106191 [Glycomyces harbinensis]